MSHPLPARLAGSVLAAALLLFAMALPVAAHITIPDGAVVPSGGSAVISFRVPHGCGGEPTTAISVQLPDGVVGAKPESVAGWTATTEMVPAEYELFGTKYTERVGTIRWEGGPLSDAEFKDFAVRATFQMDPGEYPIPVVQECGQTTESWIEVPAAGQTEDDLELPAPTITVVAAVADGDDDHAATPSAASAADASTSLSDSQAPLILSLVALAAGLGGLALGGYAVRRHS